MLVENWSKVFDGRPPWHVMSSRELASALGVSLQTTANWRIRNLGPPTEPANCFKGNRTYYRLDKAECWAREKKGTQLSPLEVDRRFLLEIFPDADKWSGDDVQATIVTLEKGRVFPHRWPPRSLAYLEL
jgi:hypothetical protein